MMVDAHPVDIHLLCEEYEHVEEVEEVVGEWAFHVDKCPIILKIKVVKTAQPPDMYVGLANYMIQSPNQGAPYMSIRPKDTVKEALQDALRGFLKWYNPEEAEKTRYVPYKEW